MLYAVADGTPLDHVCLRVPCAKPLFYVLHPFACAEPDLPADRSVTCNETASHHRNDYHRLGNVYYIAPLLYEVVECAALSASKSLHANQICTFDTYGTCQNLRNNSQRCLQRPIRNICVFSVSHHSRSPMSFRSRLDMLGRPARSRGLQHAEQPADCHSRRKGQTHCACWGSTGPLWRATSARVSTMEACMLETGCCMQLLLGQPHVVQPKSGCLTVYCLVVLPATFNETS